MVAMSEIREFSRRIAEEFKPRRIILFGSHARGEATEWSDVDLLVELPYSGHPTHKAIEMVRYLNPRFAVDLIIRSPREVKERMALNDWFILDIVEKGKVLYEAPDRRMGGQGGRRLRFPRARTSRTQVSEL
jgi:predicted nucleotidyltransferase